MEALEVLRALGGLAVVLFLPGFALTMALWPRSRKEVQLEVVGELKKRGIKDAAVVGREDEAEYLVSAMRENGINPAVNPGPEDRIEAWVVLGSLSEERPLPEADVVIDLGQNLEGAVEIENTIDGVERIALSFGLSVALVPLLGIILDKTPYGIRLQSILAALILVIALFMGVYYYRRRSFNMPVSPAF